MSIENVRRRVWRRRWVCRSLRDLAIPLICGWGGMLEGGTYPPRCCSGDRSLTVMENRRGPGTRGGRRSVVEQYVQLGLRRHTPVLVDVRIELGSIFLRFIGSHRQGRIRWHCVHRLIRVRGDPGQDRTVRHLITDLCLRRRGFDPAARPQGIGRHRTDRFLGEPAEVQPELFVVGARGRQLCLWHIGVFCFY